MHRAMDVISNALVGTEPGENVAALILGQIKPILLWMSHFVIGRVILVHTLQLSTQGRRAFGVNCVSRMYVCLCRPACKDDTALFPLRASEICF